MLFIFWELCKNNTKFQTWPVSFQRRTRPLPTPPPPLPPGRIYYRCRIVVAHVAGGGIGVLFWPRSFASSDLVLMFYRLRGRNKSTRSILCITGPLIPTARQAGINVNKNNSKWMLLRKFVSGTTRKNQTDGLIFNDQVLNTSIVINSPSVFQKR